MNDKLHASFDGSYVEAKTNNSDMLVADDIQVNAGYQYNGSGPPKITVLPGDNINYATGLPKQSGELLQRLRPGSHGRQRREGNGASR